MDEIILADTAFAEGEHPTIKVEQLFDDEDELEIYSMAINEQVPDKGFSQSLFKPLAEEILSDGYITVVPHNMMPEEDEMHIISENSESFQFEEVEKDKTSSPTSEEIATEEVDERNPFSNSQNGKDLRSPSPTISPVHIKVDPSTRKGIQDFPNLVEDQFPSKEKYIKIDKADPRSRLHFLKYMKKDGKTVKIWECGICGKEFFHQYTLIRHLPIHTDERNYKCQVCGKSFRQLSTLSQHKNIHSEIKPYACGVCQKTFSRASSLISHKKTHLEKKSHVCTICGKAFHQKGNLKNHIFTHTKERPYKCDICGKGFNQSSNLHCHKSKIHVPYSSSQNTNEKYKCNLCNTAYARRAQLRQHEEYHHGIKDVYSTRNILKLNIAPGRNSFLHKKKIGNVRIIRLPNGDKALQESRNGLLIDPIDTKAMHKALSLGQTPFALLKPAHGIPVIVKVQFAAGSKHMLVLPSSSELKSAGKFVVSKQKESNKSAQIKITIPVVATICQKIDENGEINLEVLPPSDDIEEGASSTPSTHSLPPPIITERRQALQSSYIKSSINKSKNSLTQHFFLSPSFIKSSTKDSSFPFDNQDSQVFSTLVDGFEMPSQTNALTQSEVDILAPSVELASHEQVTIKDDILDMGTSAHYLRPTGVIGEYEVLEASEVSTLVGEETIINPIKDLFEDSGPVAIDPSQFSTLMDVLQNAGYQLQTHSDGEDIGQAVLSSDDPNTEHVILKADGTLVADEQLLISHKVTLDEASSTQAEIWVEDSVI